MRNGKKVEARIEENKCSKCNNQASGPTTNDFSNDPSAKIPLLSILVTCSLDLHDHKNRNTNCVRVRRYLSGIHPTFYGFRNHGSDPIEK